jgi:hypothetical protein
MAVGQQEEGLIALVLNDGQEALEFLLREKLHPAGAAPRVGYEWFLWGSHILDRIPVLSDAVDPQARKSAENRPHEEAGFLLYCLIVGERISRTPRSVAM